MGIFGGVMAPMATVAQLTALAGEVTTLGSNVATLDTQVAGQKVPWLGAGFIDVPILLLGASVDRSVTCTTADAPASDYSLTYAYFGLLPSALNIAVKSGTRAVNGLTLTLTATSAIALSTGKILVIAGRSASQPLP